MKKMRIWQFMLFTTFLGIVFLTGCKDHLDGKKVEHNPDKPITIASFTPDSGRVATQMLIYGENFGYDKSQINVFVNDKKAAVMGVNEEGTMIYCIVPSFKDENEYVYDGQEDSGSVRVKIGSVEATADKNIHYTYTQNVSTFLGFTDQDGNTAVVDGSFEKAQFQTPFWLAFDKETTPGMARNFYLIEENVGLRFIDMQKKQVETVFRTGNGVDRPRTIAFTHEYDTMIVANDHGEWTGIGTIMLVRDSTGKFPSSWTAVMHHKQCNGGAIHPITGEYWFNSYEKSQVYKVKDRSGNPWRYGNASALNEDGKEGTNYFFLVQDNDWEFSIQIAPSGQFAYIVSKNKHYIARMAFNTETSNFEKPQPYVGRINSPGYADGVGLATKFHQPQQGAFDADDNFYVCDGENNCIRKITPTGQVSTFAGRPENAGYSNGALRDAQFDSPFGIIYDDINNTFYVADRDNSRIRTIKVE